MVLRGAWLSGPVSGRHVAAGTEWNLDALSARPRISAPQHLPPHPGLGGRGIKRTEARECYANRRLAVLDRSHLFLVKRREKKKKNSLSFEEADRSVSREPSSRVLRSELLLSLC